MPSNDDRNALVEQRRRIAEAYRTGLPSDADLARARRRFEARRSRSAAPLSRVWAMGLAQGFAAGLVTLAAASFVGAKVLPRLAEMWAPPAVEQRMPRAVRDESPAPRAPAPPKAGAPPAVPPPAAAFPEMPAAEHVVPPVAAPPAEKSRTATLAARTPLPPPLAPSAPAVPTAAWPGNEPGSATAAWTHVAEAMAARDYPRAEAALARLAASGDAATRDAAALSRAELWVARGSGGSVRADVERLSREGQTPLIRRRAAELLARLDGAR